MSENRDCSVKASPYPFTEVRIPSRGIEALTLPRLRLCADSETKNAREAASGTSTAASINRESTASSSTTITTQSRSSSAEPTKSPTSSTAYPSSSSALDPPSSPVRIPARLRRKCPRYAQLEEREDHASAVEKKNAGPSNIESTHAAEGPQSPPQIARVNPVIVMASQKQGKPEHAARRQRNLPPVPVPHLIKKSRGRRVPEPDEARERTHICAVPGCSKSFARAEHLKRHVISLHTHEKRTFSLSWATPPQPHPPFFTPDLN